MYYETRAPVEKPFPVADGFFKPVTLTAQRLAELREEGQRALQRTLAESVSAASQIDTPPWRLRAQHNGLREYARSYRSHATLTASRIIGAVDGDFRAFVQSLKTETRAEYFNVQRRLHPSTLDAAVLCNVPQRSATSSLASEGVKWAAYEAAALRFRMDSCHFEMTGEGVDDATGRPYAYRIVLPALFPEVSDLFKSKRTLRVVSKSVMLVWPREASAASSEIFMTMYNDFKTNEVSREMHTRFLASLHKVGATVMSPQQQQTRYELFKNAWVVVQQRSACGVCARAFTLLRSRHQCNLCSDIVCRKCLVKGSEVDLGGSSAKAVARMCIFCVNLLREDAKFECSADAGPVDGKKRRPSRLRMSEAPTEGSMSEYSASFVSTGGPLRRPSDQGWLLSPSSQRGGARSRVASSTSSYSSSSSRHAFGDGDDEHEAILEEAAPPRRGVPQTPEEDRSISGLEAVLQEDMFVNISVGLHEQQTMLQQLQQHAARGGR